MLQHHYKKGDVMEVIYIDVLLLLNLCFNGVLLYVTGKLAKQKILIKKWLIATVIATCYFMFDFFIVSSISSLLFNIVIAFVINYIMFGKIYLWKHVGLFYFLTFILGGMILAIHQFIPQSEKLQTYFLFVQNISGSTTSVTVLTIGLIIFILFVRWQMHAHIRTTFFQTFMYDIVIQMIGRTNTTRGFLDSGNQLLDPLTNKPVIIVEEAFLQSYFNPEEWDLFKHACMIHDLTLLPNDIRKSVQIVPFQGVQGAQDMLYTIQPKNIIIYNKNKKYETDHVLIGVQFGTLSNEHGYQCLLHPDLLHIHVVQAA